MANVAKLIVQTVSEMDSQIKNENIYIHEVQQIKAGVI